MPELACDVLIVGGGAGGCAAALAASDLGCRVVLAEGSQALGGQLTTQLTPPDEHPWIEEFGCTARYRAFRDGVRAAYRATGRLTAAAAAEPRLNPGGGWVSRLCYEPAFGLAALDAMLAPARASGLLEVRLGETPAEALVEGDRVSAVRLRGADGEAWIRPQVVLDATELGDLLPLAGAEYVVGSESVAQTGEPHASATARPRNQQSFTWCFALSHDPGSSRIVERPASYARWLASVPPGWPGPQLGFDVPDPRTGAARRFPLFADEPTDRYCLFEYRKLVDPARLAGAIAATSANWPMNDYCAGTLLDVPQAEREAGLAEAKELSLSLLYWLQTEGGFPGLYLRPDVAGTDDGFAAAPYIRESRRIVARARLSELDVSAELHPGADRAPPVARSIGVGCYRIDLHPSADGAGFVDIAALPFELPLGILLPIRLSNLLPAAKNAGATHVANGCTRLHPTEWNLGEAAGLLAAFSAHRGEPPCAALEREADWDEFRRLLQGQGVETRWPGVPLGPV